MTLNNYFHLLQHFCIFLQLMCNFSNPPAPPSPAPKKYFSKFSSPTHFGARSLLCTNLNVTNQPPRLPIRPVPPLPYPGHPATPHPGRPPTPHLAPPGSPPHPTPTRPHLARLSGPMPPPGPLPPKRKSLAAAERQNRDVRMCGAGAERSGAGAV